MNDKQSAAILIGIAVVMFVLWYRGRSESERSTLFGLGDIDTGPQRVEAPGLTGKRAQSPTGAPLDRLLAFANAHGLYVTSPKFVDGKIVRGKHNVGSPHYEDRAIDVRSRGLAEQFIQNIKAFAEAAGIKVFDERTRPPGQKVWGGPHLHLELPK